MNQSSPPSWLSLSRVRWALLLGICLTAAFLRLWRLGDLPPGLYRDEAFNGLDALTVWQGQHPIFFAANNGREPLYIYLTSLFVHWLGPTAVAVRLGAAVVGSITTLIVYKLAAEWFDEPVGLFSAWLWAVTVWPIHLSRIGLRIILLAPLLSLAFWLATCAYRQQKRSLWLAAGALYGLSCYTYAAVRFTPALLVALLLYVLWQGHGRRLWPGLGWAAVGTAVVLAPLVTLAVQQPELVLGRVGQVSILQPAVNGGDFWGTLLRQVGAAVGLFFWQGDVIIRHNPAGRPLFDPIMALFFVAGLVWCVRHWRQPAVVALLLWVGIMLGPTILAEDAPHFLRAAGILPVSLVIPAIGLSWLAAWPKLAPWWRTTLVGGVLLASMAFTVRDYFIVYAAQPDTAYLFEAAARDLAERINAETAATTVVVDERFTEGWPSVTFLLRPQHPTTRFAPAAPTFSPPVVFYLWPHDPAPLAAVPALIGGPAWVSAAEGSLARGDLEPEPYPLFVRYAAQPWPTQRPMVALLGDLYALHTPTLTVDGTHLTADLFWSVVPTSTAASEARPPLTVFIHVLDKATGQLVAQSDAPPAQGYWPSPTWRPDLLIQDTHQLTLPTPYTADRYQIVVGLYPSGRADAPVGQWVWRD